MGHSAMLGAKALPGAPFTNTELHPDTHSGWHTQLHAWVLRQEDTAGYGYTW